MPPLITDSSTTFDSGSRWKKISRRELALFALFILLGGLASVNPLYVLYLAAALAVLGVCWLVVAQVRRAHLELWQILALIGVSGHMLLNYGWDNLALHIGGLPIVLCYAVMFSSLALAVYGRRRWLASALKEPAVRCVLALLVLAAFHLAIEIPRFGVMAVRDATMCIDALFMLVGMAWATKKNALPFLAKWLTVLFALNLIYGATLPWSATLWSWSPESGVFLKVPLLGNYNGTGDLLLSGALFCIFLGSYVIKRPSWLILVLALAQFLGVGIAQVRRMYVGAVIVLFILILLGETKKFARVFVLLPAALVVLLLATTVGGLQITGRIGTVNFDFFKEHIRSIYTSEGTPGSSVESRWIMAQEAFQHFFEHPVTGVGFGEPLLSEMDMNMGEGNNAVTRHPHDSSLSYLARLGAIGFILWISFHVCVIKRFLYGLRQKRFLDDQLYSWVLWLFLYYVLFMITSLVEGPFEFPSGAIPFYFFIGFALGLIRWRVPEGRQSMLTMTSRAPAHIAAGTHA